MTLLRKALAGTLAGCLSLVSACGSGEPEQTDSGPLVVWFPGNSETEMKLLKETVIPAFKQQTGTDVQVTFVDWAEISPKLNAAFAAGTAPDIIGHGVAATADLVHNDRIEDMTPYVEKLPAADREDLAAALPGGQVKGKQYNMPVIMTIRLIVYSGADFKAAGLNPDQPPQTWEAVKTTAEQLTKRDGGKITHAGLAVPSNPIGAQQAFGTLLWSSGGEYINAEGTKATLNSPEAVKALQFYTSLFQGPTAVDNTLGGTWSNSPPAQQPIVTGGASMQLSNSGDITKYQKAAPDRDLRVVMPPAFQGSKGRAFGGAANGLMINKDSKHKDRAWDFIKYMTTGETSVKYAETVGSLPIRASAAKSAYVTSNPELLKTVKALAVTHANPNVPGWVQMRDAIGKQLEQALHGKISAADALKQAATEVDKIIAANQ